MRLEPLDRIRFTYPEDWMVELKLFPKDWRSRTWPRSRPARSAPHRDSADSELQCLSFGFATGVVPLDVARARTLTREQRRPPRSPGCSASRARTVAGWCDRQASVTVLSRLPRNGPGRDEASDASVRAALTAQNPPP